MSKRNYHYNDINEMGDPRMFIDRKPHPRFGYELGLLEKTNPQLIANFNKCANWIAENCPTLNGEFWCRHNPYYWVRLVVEDGKAYLEEGSHGYNYSTAMSIDDTATFSRGSMQSIAKAFRVQFFRNDRLEEFLSQWQTIKAQIQSAYAIQSNVFSESFTA